MKTIKTYQCECGEDFYEDDVNCVNCRKPIDKTKLKNEEVADIKYTKNIDLELNKMMDIKKALEEAGIDAKNIAYVPLMPTITPFPKEFMIEEIMGIRVLRLVSAPND